MTIKECIDTVDNIKPNQYGTKEKVLWLSFIDEIIINDVLKTHEGYDGRYDNFTGYSENKLSMPLIVPSPYDRLYTAYLKMKIDGENGETARYNNSAAMFNTYMMEYKKYYNKTHLPLTNGQKPMPPKKPNAGLSDAELENLKKDLYHELYNDVVGLTSADKINAVVTSYMNTNAAMLKGKDGVDGKDGYTPRKGVDYFDGAKGEKGEKGDQGEQGIQGEKGEKGDTGEGAKDKIGFWQPNTEYKVGDYCICNQPHYYGDLTFILKCTESHTSSNDIYNDTACWENNSIFAMSSVQDSEGNVIHETYATKKELSDNHYTKNEIGALTSGFVDKGALDDYFTGVETEQCVASAIKGKLNDFGIAKLLPNGGTFEIEPNMFCLIVTGGELCVEYWKKEPLDGGGTSDATVVTGMGTGLMFSTLTNPVVDNWDTTYWYRVGVFYQASNNLLSGTPFKSRNDALLKNAWLKNTSTSTNVYVYYIKQC